MRWPNGRSSLLAVLIGALVAAPPPASAAPVRDHLYGVRALGGDEAWAVGTFGGIYHTTDGGRSWMPAESGTKQPLFSLDFAPGGRLGFAVGKSATVLATADGGRTWRRRDTPIGDEKHFFKVKAIDERTAWAVGDWGAITMTDDGGETWHDRSLGTITVRQDQSPGRTTNVVTDDVILYDVSFPDPQHGFICGEFGTVLATADGGRHWELRRPPTEKTLFGVHFSAPLVGWVVGMDGLLMRTQDGGRSWTVQHGEPDVAAVDEISFVESMKNPGVYAVRVEGDQGVAVGDVGLVLVSTDGGRSWQRRELPGGDKLVWVRDVSLAPGARGFIVGGSGFNGIVTGDQVTQPAAAAQAAGPE